MWFYFEGARDEEEKDVFKEVFLRRRFITLGRVERRTRSWNRLRSPLLKDLNEINEKINEWIPPYG